MKSWMPFVFLAFLLTTVFAGILDDYPPFDITISSPENNSNITQNCFEFIAKTNHDNYFIDYEYGLVSPFLDYVLLKLDFENDTSPFNFVDDVSENNNNCIMTARNFTYDIVTSPTGSSVQIAGKAVCNITQDWQTFSVSFWVRLRNPPANSIMGRYSNTSNEGWYFQFVGSGNSLFRIYQQDGSFVDVTITASGTIWSHYTVDVINGEDLYIFKDGVPFEYRSLNGYAETNNPFIIQDIPIDSKTIYLDEVRYSSDVVKESDIFAFMGDNMTLSRYFIGLLPNQTYWLKACSQTALGTVVCDFAYFNTSESLGSCGVLPTIPFSVDLNVSINLYPDVKLYGTENGWVTSDSTPEIRYIVSDDSQIGWNCSLYVDGLLDKTFTATAVQSSVQINQTLTNEDYLISMTCTDIEGATGSSDIYTLYFSQEFNFIPVSVCAYDNDTLQALNGNILVVDKSGRIIFNEPFETCFSREIQIGFGNYYDISVFVPSYLVYSYRVMPPSEFDENIYLTSYSTEFYIPQVDTLNCSDLGVNEKFDISFYQEKCDFTVWRCSTSNFPQACEIIGSDELFGAEQSALKIESSIYYGDYIILQGSCEPSLKCFHIVQERFESPGVLVNLAKAPSQGYFIIILLIVVGMISWTVGR